MRIGIVKLDSTRRIVRLRRSWPRGWRAIGGGKPDDLPRHRQAWLLAPRDTIVITGTSEEVHRRHRRLESVRGASLMASPFPVPDGQVGVVLACRGALARLPEGVCAVPVELALARLASLVTRRTTRVTWESPGLRVEAVSRRGKPAPGQTPHHRCEITPSASFLDPRIAPLTMLATGAALALGAAGTFPPPPRPWTRTLGTLALRAVPPALVLTSLMHWWPQERSIPPLRELLVEIRREMEAWHWFGARSRS